MAKEDIKLKQHVEKARLDQWFGGIVEAAKASVEAERRSTGSEKHRSSEVTKTIEFSLSLTNGHRGSGIDEDGDVPMA